MTVPISTNPRRRRPIAVPAAVLALALGVVACGDDTDEVDSGASASTTESTAATTEAHGGDDHAADIEVTGVDYAFQGIPSTLKAGTELTFTNGSQGEVHELVVLRINDDETRSVEELLALPEEEALAAAQFEGVSVALPGEDGFVAEGDLILDEPGRYIAICAIPTGADPQAYRDVLAAPPEGEGPPDIAGGPPHFTVGMNAEFTVE